MPLNPTTIIALGDLAFRLLGQAFSIVDAIKDNRIRDVADSTAESFELIDETLQGYLAEYDDPEIEELLEKVREVKGKYDRSHSSIKTAAQVLEEAARFINGRRYAEVRERAEKQANEYWTWLRAKKGTTVGAILLPLALVASGCSVRGEGPVIKDPRKPDVTVVESITEGDPDVVVVDTGRDVEPQYVRIDKEDGITVIVYPLE